MGKRQTLRKILLAALTVLLLALLYIGLLLITSDASPTPAPTAKPVSASPSLYAANAEELVSMVNQYPGALLAAKENAGLTFRGAKSYDTAWQGGWARLAEAVYTDEQGRELRLLSFYPASAIALLDREGWLLQAAPGPTVSGCATSVMTRSGATRLALSYGSGAYAAELPAGTDIEKAAGPLQLYTKQED
ncbi:MAG: hypothetical protein IKP40_04400 [Clostridia bacterium]|nr:hypothetical protein [Clostridia bacterium]